jgi:hypothetical protein
LLEVGDTLRLSSFDELPNSSFKIENIYEDGITGLCHFDGDDFPEYGELYVDDFYLIYEVRKNRNHKK